jgi:RNA polymerase subunit RPABC4/transcription elongation factor Spt4
VLKANEKCSSFRACINPKCLLKKLDELKCPVCGVTYSATSAGHGYVAKLLIDFNNKFTVYTVFTQAMTQFMTSAKISNLQDLKKPSKK